MALSGCDDVRVGNPDSLWLMWLIPALIAFYVYSFRKRRQLLRRFASSMMLARLARNGSPFLGDRNHLHHNLQRLMPPGAALVAYWALVGVPCGLALAYPQFTLSWVVLCIAAYGTIVWKGARFRAQNAATAAARDLDSDTSVSYGENDD